MSNRPEWAIEASLTTEPFDDAPVWTDETGHVREFSAFRGRQQELDVIQPGTATLQVDNSERRYDPLYAAGPHFGNLLPGRRVRIRATYGAEGLDLPGGAGDYASSPDGGWVPGQELDLQAKLALDDWTPAASSVIFGQTDITFAQASVIWGVDNAGRLSLTWFTAGGVIVAPVSSVLGFENGSTHHLRVTLDVDNGAGQYEVKFYETFDDGASWVQIGATATGAATAVPRNSLQDFTLGSTPAGFPMAGQIYLFVFGVAIGAENMRVRFTDGQRFVGGAPSGTGYFGSTWTVHGAASYPAAERDVFGGFADGWPVPARSLGEAPVELTDGFALLSASEIPDGSPFEATLRALRPVNYWKLGESAGAQEVADSGTSPLTGRPVGGASEALGADGLDVGSDATALALDGFDTDGYVDVSGLECSDWTTFVALLAPSVVGSRHGFILDTPDRSVFMEGTFFGGGGRISALDNASNGDRAATRIDDGAGHIVVIRRTGPAAFTFEIDGQAVADAAMTRLGNAPITSRIGWTATTTEEGTAVEGGYKGTVQHLALFDRLLSAGESGALASAAGGWIGDTIDERIDRLLDFSGWSSSERNLDASEAGELTIGAVGSDALDDVRQLERSEAGQFFQEPDYTMRFVSRYGRSTDDRSRRVLYTFTDQPGSNLFRFVDVELAAQGEWIRNRVTVSYVGGSITVEDTDSIAAYGAREFQVDTVLTSGSQAQSLGEFILTRYAEPVVRISRLTFDPGAQPILWEPLLALELGDRVRVVWQPGDVGDPIEVEALVDGKSIQAGPGEEATAELWLSSADVVDFWIWGSSVWDSSTVWG